MLSWAAAFCSSANLAARCLFAVCIGGLEAATPGQTAPAKTASRRAHVRARCTTRAATGSAVRGGERWPCGRGSLEQRAHRRDRQSSHREAARRHLVSRACHPGACRLSSGLISTPAGHHAGRPHVLMVARPRDRVLQRALGGGAARAARAARATEEAAQRTDPPIEGWRHTPPLCALRHADAFAPLSHRRVPAGPRANLARATEWGPASRRAALAACGRGVRRGSGNEGRAGLREQYERPSRWRGAVRGWSDAAAGRSRAACAIVRGAADACEAQGLQRRASVLPATCVARRRTAARQVRRADHVRKEGLGETALRVPSRVGESQDWLARRRRAGDSGGRRACEGCARRVAMSLAFPSAAVPGRTRCHTA